MRGKREHVFNCHFEFIFWNLLPRFLSNTSDLVYISCFVILCSSPVIKHSNSFEFCFPSFTLLSICGLKSVWMLSLCCHGDETYRLRTALRTRQPPLSLQHLHQADDGHLSLSSTNHIKEELHGRQEPVIKETTCNAFQWIVKHESKTPVQI